MKSPCKHPGCPQLLDKSGYCDRHQSSAPKPRASYQAWRQRDKKQSAVDSIRKTARWQKVRASKLTAFPLCEDPFQNHQDNTATAKQVHHIQGLATHPDLAFHADNLMSVCTVCHAKLEAQVRHAGGRD